MDLSARFNHFTGCGPGPETADETEQRIIVVETDEIVKAILFVASENVSLLREKIHRRY